MSYHPFHFGTTVRTHHELKGRIKKSGKIPDYSALGFVNFDQNRFT